MSNSITKACAVVLAITLAACNEPSQVAGPESIAPATDDEKRDADAGFAALQPSELTHAKRQTPMTPTTDCNLERANGTVFAGTPVDVSASSPLRLSGWVADTEALAVPETADLRLISSDDNRAWEVKVKPTLARADVQELLGGDPALARAGFSVSLDVSKMPFGRYRIYTVIPTASGLKVCDKGRAVALSN